MGLSIQAHGEQWGAFLLAYLFFVIIFAYFGLSAKYAVGRYSGTGTIGSYEKAWSHVKLLKFGKI